MALYLVIQVGAFLSRYVPRSLRYVIATSIGEVAYWVTPVKRRNLRQNMAAVVGLPVTHPHVNMLARKSMRNCFKYLIECLELPTLSSVHPLIANRKITGLENFTDELSSDRGIILATAHFGTVEIPGLRLTDFTPFHAVYDRFEPPYVDRLIQKQRQEVGIDLIPVDDVRSMLRVLKDKGTLALLFDRPLRGKGGVKVRFFGRETAVPGGPAVLAMKTGASIVPVFTFRHADRTFESVAFPAVAWTPSGDRARDIQNIMQRLMDVLQEMIRSRPDQWYMFRPMWPDAISSLAQSSETADSAALSS